MTGQERKTLGRGVIPTHYDLLFKPNPNRFRYECTERIEVSASGPTNKITLHSKGLKITSASISWKGEVYPAIIKYRHADETVRLSIKKKITGSASMLLEFSGTNDDSMYGFYRSKYTSKNRTEYILTSQFEPTSARRAFVCFDEPAFKASYDISFAIDSNLTALSNMPEVSSTRTKNGKKLVKFQTTPKMSSYLVYLGLGRYDMLFKRRPGRIYRVITVPGKKDYANMTMDFTVKFMSFLESYFCIKYPLPKIDVIAIPDFAAGAMENWGAITGREVQITGKEGITSVPVKRTVATTIAHELSHMWFGDLVTMSWWDGLWLNESFATFMATKALDAVYPGWKIGIEDKVGDMTGAFWADQLNSTHPINVTVRDPADIDSIFDEISYSKGGRVLAMMEDYIGKKAFADGLHRYLSKYSYSNATKDNLWGELKPKSRGRDASVLPQVVRFWVDEPGYPIVHADGPRNGIVKLRQRRFTIIPTNRRSKAWPIPIRYTTDAGSGFVLMKYETATLKVPNAKFIKLNSGESGFYRTSYSKENLEALGSLIRQKKLSPIDSWGVERDLVALARTGTIKLDEVLDFIEEYCKNAEYPLNMAIVSHLDSLALLFAHNKRLSARIRGLSIEFAARCLRAAGGWTEKKGEDNTTTMLRSLAIRSLGMNGDAKTIEKAGALFREYTEDRKEINPNLRSAVYNITAAQGNEATFGKLLGLYEKAGGEQKIRILGSLGSFRDPKLLLRALDFSIGAKVRLQNRYAVVASAASNPTGRRLLLEWVLTNWKSIREMYKESGKSILDFIGALSVLDNREDMERVRKFFAKKQNRVRVGDRELRNTLETIESNIVFIRNNV
jgi:tricorn protease interacting factor F2/3